MKESTSYVGLDVHKSFIQVALVRPDEPRGLGWKVPHTEAKVGGLIRKLRRLCDGRVELCYEAGPTGYGLARTLNGEGCRTYEIMLDWPDCRVVA